jgi:hypothetical protein
MKPQQRKKKSDLCSANYEYSNFTMRFLQSVSENNEQWRRVSVITYV